MNKNDTIIGMIQNVLVQNMKSSGLTTQIASEYLGYAHRSSVTRSLSKQNMSVLDAVKIMALCPIQSIAVPGLYLYLNIRTTDDVLKMKVCNELFEEFRHSVFQDGYYRKFLQGCTWQDIAAASDDYNDGESARRSWLTLATPVSLVMTILKVTGLEEASVTTKAGDSLTIGIKKRTVDPLIVDPKVFPN